MNSDNAKWPETGAGGPKEIVVCLECGMPLGGIVPPENVDWIKRCLEEHGPTQKVLVLPASLADELAEALRVITETPPMPETMREIASQALAYYRAVRGNK